jgi:hypothetical protein
MTDPTTAFTQMVPGFDFMQNLVKSAGAAMPAVGQWVAPTLDPAELDKRINDLRTVQFWLEQNAHLLGATIQALEVQRMTLATLKTMNVSLSDLTESLKIRPPAAAPAEAPMRSFFGMPAAPPSPPADTAPPAASAEKSAEKSAETPAAGPGAIDPMQWWGALTQQFTELAAKAMKDGAGDANNPLAGAMFKQKLDAAAESFKAAAAPAAPAAATKRPAAKKAAAPRSPGKPG